MQSPTLRSLFLISLGLGCVASAYSKGGGGGHGGGGGGGGGGTTTPTNVTTAPVMQLYTGTTVLTSAAGWQGIFIAAASGTTAELDVGIAVTLEPTNGNTIAVGDEGTGTLVVSSSGAITQTSNNAILQVGAFSGSTGTLNVTGGTITTTGGLDLGFSGTGTMNITGGGVVTTGDFATYDTGIGVNGGIGTLTISGAGSAWKSNDQYYFALGGYEGSATVTIEAGGLLTTNNALFNTGGTDGLDWGGTSTVTITGPGSEWKNAESLMIGNAAATTLESTVTVENGGTLQVGADGSPGALTVSKGGELNIGGGAASGTVVASSIDVKGLLDYDFTDTSLTAAGNITVESGATFQKDGSGTLVVSDSGSSTHSGSTITLSAGALQASASFLTNASIADNASLIVEQTNAGTLSSLISGSGTVTVAGTGAITLSGTNTYSGATTVTGLLDISTDANLGTAPNSAKAGQLILNGGTLTATHSFTLNANRGLQVNAAGGTLSVASADTLTYGGVIGATGGGALTKSGMGTLVLAGSSPGFAGGFTVAQGFVNLSGSLSGSSVALAGGTLYGSGSVGALSLASGGILSPGTTIGSLTASSATLGGGTYLWQIDAANGSAGSATGWDLLNVTHALTLGGTLADPFTIDIETMASTTADGVPAAFNPEQAYTFEIATASSIGGVNASHDAVSTGLVDPSITGTWSLEVVGNTLDLAYTPVSAVPEVPATGLAAGAATALAVALARRRKALAAA